MRKNLVVVVEIVDEKIVSQVKVIKIFNGEVVERVDLEMIVSRLGEVELLAVGMIDFRRETKVAVVNRILR